MRTQGQDYAVSQMMRRVRVFTVWLLEIVSVAIGTAWIFFVIPAVQHFGEVVHDFRTRELIGIAGMVLIEFTLTGYLITTGLASAFLRRRGKFVHPTASAAL